MVAADFLALDPVAHGTASRFTRHSEVQELGRSRDREIRYAVRLSIACRTNCSAVSNTTWAGVYIIFASPGEVKHNQLTPAAPAASLYMLQLLMN